MEADPTGTARPNSREQRLRLQRALLGVGAYASALLITLGCWWAGHLDGTRALHAAVGYVVLSLGFVLAVHRGWNLRLRDPSMTAPQIMLSVLPSGYAMYHVDHPQLRVVFLLTAVAGMIFGAFRFDLRRLAPIAGWMLGTYLVLLVALHLASKQVLDWRVETVTVVAYAMMLSLMAMIGSYIRGLRSSLGERNRALQQAMQDLHRLATRDALTLLPNRGAMMEHLTKEVARAERRLEKVYPLCVAILDVDLFKRINDSWGHAAGDAVLQQVAAVLQRTMRTADVVGRIGGEEFLLVLPDTHEPGGVRAAERVREHVEAAVVSALPPGERITVSIGVAVQQPGETAEAVMARADSALYRAKHRGRNRVELSPAAEAIAVTAAPAAPDAPAP